MPFEPSWSLPGDLPFGLFAFIPLPSSGGMGFRIPPLPPGAFACCYKFAHSKGLKTIGFRSFK